MIRIAIVDDDIDIQKTLKKFLETFEESTKEKFNISVFSDAKDIVDEYRPVYDIIFMDIQMQVMDGMTGAEKIRQLDKNVLIIFVTNMTGYAIKGYKVDAMSYVVKPIMYVDFAQQVKKAIKKLEYKKTTYILLSVNNEIIRMDVSKICYMEKREHKVMIKTETEELAINSSIKKLEQEVADYQFAKCNSGLLVNLSHVEGVQNDMVKVNGQLLPISRPKKKSFMNALSDFIGGE